MDKIQHIVVFIFVMIFLIGSAFILNKVSNLEKPKTDKDK